MIPEVNSEWYCIDPTWYNYQAFFDTKNHPILSTSRRHGVNPYRKLANVPPWHCSCNPLYDTPCADCATFLARKRRHDQASANWPTVMVDAVRAALDAQRAA